MNENISINKEETMCARATILVNVIKLLQEHTRGEGYFFAQAECLLSDLIRTAIHYPDDFPIGTAGMEMLRRTDIHLMPAQLLELLGIPERVAYARSIAGESLSFGCAESINNSEDVQ